MQHSDGVAELQGIEFPFSLIRFFLKTFTCVAVWPPVISWRFLLRLNAIIGVAWNTWWNSVFICKIFQFLFTILDKLRSVLLYVIVSGILFLFLFFSLHVNSSFLSILLTFLICSSRTYPLYCRSRNFCLMIAQFSSNFVLAEQIVFSLKAWLYGMLLFKDLGCSDLACKNACWSVGLRYKVVWMLLFLSSYNIVSRNAIFLGETWKSNLIVLCFSFRSFMNVINSVFVPFHIMNMSSIYLRYNRHLFNVWIDVFCLKFAIKMFA